MSKSWLPAFAVTLVAAWTTPCMGQLNKERKKIETEATRKLQKEEATRKLQKEKVSRVMPEGSKPKKVVGTVVVAPDGTAEISTDRGVIVPVDNPDDLKKLPRGMKYEFNLSRTDNTVKLEGISLPVLGQWQSSKNQFALDRFQSLHRAYGDLEKSVKDLEVKGAMGVGSPALAKALNATSAELTTAYKSLRENEHDIRHKICGQFAEIRKLKARFGRSDIYWPEVYQKMYENSRSAVAVARKGRSTPFGSGVMIGKSLILTCLHVAEQYPTTELEVWFDYETTSSGEQQKTIFPVREILFRGLQSGVSERPYDFAVLEIGPAVDGTLAESKFAPTVLSKGQPARDDAIYVIGHPGERPRMVHDNAFVLFPFRVSETGMTHLRMIVCHETKGSPNAESELGQFLDSYIANGSNFDLYSKRWWRSPMLAADCDTSHGNSGSGVWDRATNGLIGILFAGEDDIGPDESHSPGWGRHEAILPVPVIVEQLDASLPDWRTKYGVTFK